MSCDICKKFGNDVKPKRVVCVCIDKLEAGHHHEHFWVKPTTVKGVLKFNLNRLKKIEIEKLMEEFLKAQNEEIV